ncbi:hypothetical protein ASE21_15055 [Flavobacterium sp. Root901]|uniref:hypothetical protein n=1 Tax=Flavobacterium sp. Root901 TaxID=1736605 RepID=UPI00070D98D7|nr:hypothetical protein [Flavobacterium sp. Root901]KRD09160.1 hypothetical protein ASE21_15055 [Flavobacterium sp. Root901]
MEIKLNFKEVIVGFALIYCSLCGAQENKLKANRSLNLNGPVKTVNTVYSFYKQSITPLVKYRVLFENDIANDDSYEFNKEGLPIQKAITHRTKGYEDRPEGELYKYQYDEKDYILKKDLLPYLSISKPLSIDLDLQIQTNFAIENRFKNDKDYKIAKLDSANIALNQHQDRYSDLRQFQYQYKTEGNKIIEEKVYYKPKPEQKIFKSPSENELLLVKTFKYDSKGNLTECNFDSKNTGPYRDSNGDNKFSYACDTKFKCYYDDKSKIAKITWSNYLRTFLTAIYTYDSTNTYVQKIHITGQQTYPYPSDDLVFNYNENNDLVEVNFISEDEINQPANRYYEYEYDNHKNWIKCKMYLEGNKNELTATMERKIQYFK